MGNRLGGLQRKREKPEHAAMKVSMKRVKGLEHVNKLPNIIPRRHCLLRLLKQNRVHDYLLLEIEFIKRQNLFKSLESQKKEERKVVQQLRGTPTTLAKVHELFNDEQHAVVVVEGSKREWFVPILSIVDKDLLHLNALVMVKASGMFKNVPTAIVGVLPDTTDSSALGHKLDKPPKETFEDIGGLEGPIQEMKESVELPLTHPEYYEEMGITAPKGVILYGEPGTGKTLLAKAVANSTSATFIRATGADLVQKNSGDGAKLVRELFKMAKDSAPCIVFLDEIDAVGTKRYDTSSRGEQEVQRTLLELLNQLDGFESRGDVKVILATNRIDSLDSALLRPGRIDRKIELPKPDDKTRQKIFSIHTSGMNLAKDVSFEAVMAKEKTMSGAEIKVFF
ncbi:26S proteasome subunit P45 family protein [Necator americanus]|uniref:26S proteasome subunit P45 family protein n=1 Tax=Necator americanus TaxID=51031 RepID=W2TDG4_NECAM|nr:26S proteasome subunit P45 family protein [Necator americanus]ETN79057.1 26S proteasome subunit P45 family protein [Necator americanus]